MTRPTIRTDRAREMFLNVLAERCNVSEAARAAGIGRRSAYDWREAEPDFAQAWDDAEQEAADKLEAMAWERAEQSDRMLEILLKGHRPEKYVERVKTELTGKDGGPLKMQQVMEDVDAFTRGIAGIAARGGTRTETGGAGA